MKPQYVTRQNNMLDLLDKLTLRGAIELLTEMIEINGSTAFLNVKTVSYYDSSDVTLTLEALETDEECLLRELEEKVAQEAEKKTKLARAEKDLEKQRKLYEKLKKEFENDEDQDKTHSTEIRGG